MSEFYTEEFWLEAITDENGELDKQKILNELHDFGVLIETMHKLVYHYSKGKLSKAHYTFEVIKAEIEEYFSESWEDEHE